MRWRLGIGIALSACALAGIATGIAHWNRDRHRNHLRAEGAFEDSCLSALRRNDAPAIEALLARSGSKHDSSTRHGCRQMGLMARQSDSLEHPALYRKRALDALVESDWDALAQAMGRKLSGVSSRPRLGPADLSELAGKMRACLERFPAHLGCAQIHAIAMVDLRLPDSLQGTFDSTWRLHPNDPVLQNTYALVLLGKGKASEALREFTFPTPFPSRPGAAGDFVWLATHRGRMAALVSSGHWDSAVAIPDQWTIPTGTSTDHEHLRVVSTAAETMEWIGCKGDKSCLRDIEQKLRLKTLVGSR